jgi:hypothetical protein
VEVFSQVIIIHLSVKQHDYDCLVEHVAEEDANASSALRRADSDGQRPDGRAQWRVACSPTDAVVMLRVALTHCPDAVPDIRAALNSAPTQQ